MAEGKLEASDKEKGKLDASDKEIAARRKKEKTRAKELENEARHEEEINQHVEDGWQELCKALGVDQKKMTKATKKSCVRGVVKIAYMLVLAGCELDLYGFAMAFQGYWELKNEFMKILLVVGPVGYFVATLMYMLYNTPWIHKMWNEIWEGEPAGGGDAVTATTPSSLESIAPPPIQLKYFHILPICRYYCVLKEKTGDDIEAIFRVNSLSSFSLGIAQLCGIVLKGVETQWAMDIFTWINVGSQVVNWSITIMYFLTPVSSKMSATIKIDGLIIHSRHRLRKRFEKWKKIIEDDDPKTKEEDKKTRKEEFIRSIDQEICALTNKNPPLEDFTMEMKFQALISLHIIQNTVYAEI